MRHEDNNQIVKICFIEEKSLVAVLNTSSSVEIYNIKQSQRKFEFFRMIKLFKLSDSNDGFTNLVYDCPFLYITDSFGNLI